MNSWDTDYDRLRMRLADVVRQYRLAPDAMGPVIALAADDLERVGNKPRSLGVALCLVCQEMAAEGLIKTDKGFLPICHPCFRSGADRKAKP